MKPTHTIHALVPEPNVGFQCLGSDCPDTCCTGWTVPIDKPTFLEYKKSTHPELRTLFLTRLHREKEGGLDHYGTIKLKKEDNSCSFLDDGLCRIQKTLGADALSDTCSGYPRITLQHGDVFQQGLTLSCPEAANRILLQQGVTQFVPAPVLAREDQVVRIRSSARVPTDVTQAIRFFCLKLIRQEELAAWEKMAILGFFCEEAGAIQMQEQPPGYLQLIAKYGELLESGSLKQTIAAISSYPQAQVKVFAGILFSKLLKSNTKHQRAVLEGFLKRLFGEGESMPQEEFQRLMLEKYIEGIPRLDAVLSSGDAAHFVTNFLANQMFNEGFPFNEAGIFKSYLRLTSRFGSLRMLLALRCADPDDPPTPRQLAALTQVYARKFEHDQVFKAAINQALHGVGFESMKYVVGLIRD